MKPEGNILVLTQWSFKDALVQAYTLPYVDIIRHIIQHDRKIIMVTAEQPHLALSKNEANIINKEWESKNMELLALPYKRFGIKKFLSAFGQIIKLYRVIKKEKIKVIHAFCTPAGSMAYLLSKITGAKLVIDSYEPHAESMVENGTWKKNGWAFRILYALEKKQTVRASVLIATSEGMKQYALEKFDIQIKNYFVKPACVDMEMFSQQEKNITLLKELKLENKIVCVYAGKLGGIYLKEEVFDFIKACYDHWKNDFRFLMLTIASKAEIDTELERTGLPPDVVISKFVFHREIPQYLSLGDFAINPVKPVPTKRYCTSIKDGEYWAMGLPVVISPEISDDSGIIERENTGLVIDFSKKEDFGKTINRLEEMILNKEELQIKIRNTAKKYRSFDIAKKIYTRVYGVSEKLNGNLLILTQWSYKDALVQTATLPYVRMIRELLSPAYKIIIVTAEKKQIALTHDELVQVNKEWSALNISVYPQAYKKFGLEKFIIYLGHFQKLFQLIKRENITIIHAFCTPAGSIAYLLSRFTGSTLVMDSYEPHATAMVETGAWKKNSLSFKILYRLEKLLSKKASFVIATTAAMKTYAREKYGAEIKNYFVRPSCINFNHFYPRPKDEILLKELSLDDKLVCVYAGKLGGTYLRDEVFDFVKACHDHWGNDFRFLMLSDESDEEIERQIKRVGIPADTIVKIFVNHTEIPRYLSLGDFAINPQVPVPSKRYGTPIKDGEYWAMGMPVIISPDISDDSEIIEKNEIGVVINLQKKENMREGVNQMETFLNNNKKEELQRKIFDIAKKYRSIDIARNLYPLIYGE
ncbi:MAG TPA: glycosyltransferase [Chitinophagaceae bacterium]|nr:glycosyltransferase [Chitinophagaceae bacterium]